MRSIKIVITDSQALAWTLGLKRSENVATSRLKDGHAILKKWSQKQLEISEKLVLADQQQRQIISQNVAYDCSHVTIRLRMSFWTDLKKVLTSRIGWKNIQLLQRCILIKFLQVFNQYPKRLSMKTADDCTQTCMSTTSMSYSHLIARLLETKSSLPGDHSRNHWWLHKHARPSLHSVNIPQEKANLSANIKASTWTTLLKQEYKKRYKRSRKSSFALTAKEIGKHQMRWVCIWLCRERRARTAKAD